MGFTKWQMQTIRSFSQYEALRAILGEEVSLSHRTQSNQGGKGGGVFVSQESEKYFESASGIDYLRNPLGIDQIHLVA
nr:hypothetical protein CFP56_65680 [Quercus suber]